MGGGGIAIGRLLGIIPCRLMHGRGILGVVLPLAPTIATCYWKTAQDDRNHPLGCCTRWNVGFSTTKKPEELAYSRSSHVVDGTPQRVVDHLYVEVKQT